MRSTSRIVTAVAFGTGCAFVALPALAGVCQHDFSLAKVIKQGTTSKDIAGSGTVQLQVQVNADGTHKVTKVIRSSNKGDNEAAIDIASTSTYRPAHCGSTPTVSFYDFTLKFNGKSVQAADALGNAGVENLIRSGKYPQAEAAARAALAANPNDNGALVLLGVASYYGNDLPAAAAAFAKANPIPKPWPAVAAQSLANQAVKLSESDPTTALAYAQKAVALDPGTNSQFALGVAEIGEKQFPQGIATLKSVHARLFADPKTTKNVKFGVDSHLLAAYLANNDTADAAALAAEMQALNPSSMMAAELMGSHYLTLGNQAQQAKNYDEAIKNYDLAAASKVPQLVANAYSSAVFAIMNEQKPDYNKALIYGQKALAAAPDDVMTNYAVGVAQAAVWATGHQESDKKQALVYLTKADGLAKAAGNTQLSTQIETFIAHNIEAPHTGSTPPP